MPEAELPILQTEIDHAVRRPWSVARLMRDLIGIAVLALMLIVPLKYYVAQPFVVEGASMIPVLQPADYLIIDELTYQTQPPRRGDVVVFRYPLDPSLYFIKRLIGMPGETVVIHGGIVSILASGTTTPRILAEPYVADENRLKDDSRTVLGDDEYFMLGDNRKASFDSRVWGPVPARNILGRAYVRVLPLSQAEFLHTE